MLAAALNYATAGRPILPLYGVNVPPPKPEDLEGDDPEAAELDYCHKKGKTPVGRPEFAPNGKDDATTDLDQVTVWWTKRPQSAIGMRTDGLVVLDVDNARGKARLAELEAEHGRPLPETLTGRTPGGGEHLVYRVPDGVEISNGHKALGAPEDLHVRGGTNGYIVVPPSMTKLGTYKWVYKAKKATAIADAPVWLLELLTRSGDERPPSQLRPSACDISAYGRRALEDEAGKVATAGNGTRNNQLNESAFSLGQLEAGGELPPGEAETALLNAADAAGLPQSETVKTIRSGLTAGRQKPRSAPPRQAATSSRLHAVEAPPSAEADSERLRGRTHLEVMALDVPPPRMLVANVVECGTVGTFAALPERYKSWLAQELAFKVANGQGRFLGEDVLDGGGPVGYWWQDDSLANEVGRIRAYAVRHGLDGDLPIRWHLNEGLRLPNDIGVLLDEIRRERQKLVVLDSLYNFLPGYDLKDEGIALVYSQLKAEVCDPTGCTIATIDHMPWPTEGNRGQKRGYGSVFKSAAIRWGIYLEKPADTLFLTASGNNIAGIKRSIATWDEEAMEMRLAEIRRKEETAAHIAELRTAEPDITQKQVAEALGLPERTVRKYWHDDADEQTSLLESDQ
jgi:hypothetical protein